ncbi:MAG: hypothetical protein HZC38_21650 [Chloroflexi bacterium]|nr:hypothetical protein [Chloroflexota bacterium]MBI5716011.1 hypothetical protein [Chloroflexota bacterium]
MKSLRTILLETAGQDVRRCAHCAFCDSNLAAEMDVTFATLIQMVIMDDEEVLTTRSLWSDEALKSAPHLCANQLNLEAVMLALRDEAKRRGVKEIGD